MDVTETLLPGVGIRYEFVTRSGAHVGLISRRDGRIDVGVYDQSDADIWIELVTLTPVEADTLAEFGAAGPGGRDIPPPTDPMEPPHEPGNRE